MGNPEQLKAQQRAAEFKREEEAAAREVEQVRGQWAAHEEAMRRHHGADSAAVMVARENGNTAVRLTRERRAIEFYLRHAIEDNAHSDVERLRAELAALPPRPMPPAQPSSRKYYT